MAVLEKLNSFAKGLKTEFLSPSNKIKMRAGLAALVLGLILITACTPSTLIEINSNGEVSPEPASSITEVKNSLVFMKLNFNQPLSDGSTDTTCTGVFTGKNEITSIIHCVQDKNNFNTVQTVADVGCLFLTENFHYGSYQANTLINQNVVTFTINNELADQKNFILKAKDEPRIGEELFLVTSNPFGNSFTQGNLSFSQPEMWPFIFTGDSVESLDISECLENTCYISDLENVLSKGNSGSPIIRYNAKKKVFELVGLAAARVMLDRSKLVYILINEH